MNTYADTSLLTAYYCPEAGSDKAQAFLVKQEGVSISWLTEAEMMSAISRKVRERELSKQDARKIADLFQEHVQGGYYEVLALEATDYESAVELLGRFNTPLRTLDALHVAVALRESRPLATADDKLAKAAKRCGVKSHFVRYP